MRKQRIRFAQLTFDKPGSPNRMRGKTRSRCETCARLNRRPLNHGSSRRRSAPQPKGPASRGRKGGDALVRARLQPASANAATAVHGDCQAGQERSITYFYCRSFLHDDFNHTANRLCAQTSTLRSREQLSDRHRDRCPHPPGLCRQFPSTSRPRPFH